MKKPRLIALILVLLVTGGLLWMFYTRNSAAQLPLQASGTIEATVVNLSAKNSGTIEKLNFEEGDTVKKNQLLAELSRPDLLHQHEKDAMSLLAAEARLNDLTSGAREQEIRQAAANVNMARINLSHAEDDLAQTEQLFNAGGISEDKLEEVRLNTELKKDKLQVAEAQLNLIQAGTRPDLIAGAEAELQRSKAILMASNAILEDLKIHSPIEGTVVNKNYEEGEYVTMGASIGNIANLDDLWIKVYIPTDDLPRIKLGQEVQCTVSGSPTVYKGTVKHIADQGEFTPKMIQTKKERTNVVFAVKITVENKDNLLKPGMPADVVFEWSEQ